MGRWPPRPSRSKFIRLSVDYCNRFVKDARILVYGGRREEGGGWEYSQDSLQFESAMQKAALS